VRATAMKAAAWIGWYAMVAAAVPAQAQTPVPLPSGFVHLRAVDASSLQDVRYATARNFTAAPVPGYAAGECILLRRVAHALKLVQDDLRKRNLSLKVYDCYRPMRAVASFVAWVAKPGAAGDSRYYPRTKRSQLIKQGYIASTSDHSRGIAVDLTLVALPLDAKLPATEATAHAPCTASKLEREADISVDMGTGFDCFDARSHTDSKDITAEQRAMRATLSAAMVSRGFTGYRNEWWHFTFADAGAARAHDFVVVAAPASSSPSR
jgi:zinc D-Ala-D-Ala dipeptidase